jgi:hypothetical protein
MLKEHNADYLSDSSLKWHRKFGIHAANVAPEFGVTETRAFISLLDQHGLQSELEMFNEIVLNGGNWAKWLAPDSRANDQHKIEIAGHYHFADPRVVELRKLLHQKASKSGVDSESYIASRVRASIDRYLRAFGYGAAR